MRHHQLIEELEAFAPLHYQESYDNSGWQVGHAEDETTGVLITLDVTEDIIEEALTKNCNLIISHHPVIFPHIKNITQNNWIGRLIMKAIQNHISIYTVHTNADNLIDGVNAKIAEKLGLIDTHILSEMKGDLYKYNVYVPETHTQKVLDAIFHTGAGHINEYSECSFTIQGTGTFRPSELSNPTIGEAGGKREYVTENRIEIITPAHLIHKIISTVKAVHPYEEVAYDIIALNNKNQSKGAGMIGYLEEEMNTVDFLKYIKKNMNVGAIKYTHAHSKKIKKVAVCGGSGAFLIQNSLAQKCDAFITSDIKYHQFFDAEDKISIIDLGHYETEQYTSEIFYDILKNKFPNFVLCISNINTNPIKYFS